MLGGFPQNASAASAAREGNSPTPALKGSESPETEPTGKSSSHSSDEPTGDSKNRPSPRPSLDVLIVGQEDYHPWQQVYSLIRRLPPGTSIHSDPNRRIGEMAKKACDGHELAHHGVEPMPGEPLRPLDLALFYHTGDEDSAILGRFREMAFDLLAKDVVVLEVRPKTYSEEARVIVNLAETFYKTGSIPR